MEVTLELVSPHNSLLGFSYKSGIGVKKNKDEVKFHELGIGLLFATLYITFY